MIHVIPTRGTDDHAAAGVGRSNDGEQFHDGFVPTRVVELAVRLVEQLEENGVWAVAIVFGDLPPHRNQPRQVVFGIAVDFVVVMGVDDDDEVVLERGIDNSIDPIEELGIDGVWRLMGCASRPTDRNPNRVESGFLNQRNMIVLDAVTPGALAGRFQAVSEVNAAAERAAKLMRVGLSGDRGLKK